MKRYFWVYLILMCGCADKPVLHPVTNPTGVDALVSSNPNPHQWKRGEPPADWSKEEDERVMSAHRALVARGKDAIPELIANLSRKEFSTTAANDPYSSAPVNYPLSVGEMCELALTEMLDFVGPRYKTRENDKGETIMGCMYFSTICPSQSAARQWWEKNRDKSLDEIREMIRDWYIERETTCGFQDEKQKESILGLIQRKFSRSKKITNTSYNTTEGAGLKHAP